jgi:hypothetical protein
MSRILGFFASAEKKMKSRLANAKSGRSGKAGCFNVFI